MSFRSLGIIPGVTPGVPKRGTFAHVDSGAITLYRQGQLTKPNRILASFGRKVRGFEGNFIPASKTTQQGSSSASPATFYPSLWPQRFEKSFYIADCFQLYYSDSACYKACNMFVNEAIRGGVKILVMGEDSTSKIAQDIADEYCQNMWGQEALFENGIAMIVGGDLYIQAACIGQYPDARIDHFLTLPAAGMERCTDDSDQFIDPTRAYSQVDTLTWGDVSYFPLWCISHTRWNHVAGERYGIPEIMTARKLGRMVELLESAKVLQNQARSSMRLHWKFGTPENPASPEEVEDLMALNGYVKGQTEPLNPNEGLKNFFTNSVSEIVPIEGDPNIHQIDHIKYLLDRYANGLPTPRQIMSLGSENINRDTLKDIRAQWMADTQRVNRGLEKPILWGFDLQLMLRGIDPELIRRKAIWSKSTIMSELEQVDMYNGMIEARTLSRKTAIALQQPITQVADIDEEIKQIEKEQKVDNDMEVKKRQAGTVMSDKLKDEGYGSTNGKAKTPVRNTN